MVIHPMNNSSKITNGRNNDNGLSNVGGPSKPNPSEKEKEAPESTANLEAAGLKDFQLGDCLGKGAFGHVYRALNWGTGETVAVKRIKLVNLPKSELRTIMIEIDLLKNLNHPNIVKYHGSVKSTEFLYIILEYCENGSLHSICKNFGKFPENLVALYMSQVLHGLLYLHEQGVIHRDIKGANILTTKEGLVKLADFGVATKAQGLHEASVVGTPYWMAPEVIELSGATTASDIWSLGCTVIELLEGRPPYHNLQPMAALFRIVNDDHPPIPESTSPTVQDFLMQCFQKDPNLRVSAKKLLKHPWIVNAKRVDATVAEKPTKYDEAVKTVQQWNEALKSPEGTLGRDSRGNSTSPAPVNRSNARPGLITLATANKSGLLTGIQRPIAEEFRSPGEGDVDNWDDDFSSSIGPTAFQLPVRVQPVDHFGGMLSSEKLKAYATTNDMPPDPSKENGNKNKSTPDNSASLTISDPMETVRPPSPGKNKVSKQIIESSQKSVPRQPPQPRTQILRGVEKDRPPSQQQGKSRVASKPATPQPQTQAQTQTPKPKQPQPPQYVSKQQSQRESSMEKSALNRSSSVFRENSVEDYSDLVAEDDLAFDKKIDEIRKAKLAGPFSPTFPHVSDLKNAPRSTQARRSPVSGGDQAFEAEDEDEISLKRIKSSAEIQKYAEKTEDEDFSDIFGADGASLANVESESSSERDPMSMLTAKLLANSWLVDEEDGEDPFAEMEENLDEMDLETKVARDKHSRLCTLVEGLVGSLKPSQSDEYLADVSEQLMRVLLESPDMKSTVIGSHGLIPILEVLDSCHRRDVSFCLLKVINSIVADSVEIQETLCFVGGIPIVTKFAYKKYSSDIRLEAAAFVRHMYQSSVLALQMFISCGGLNVLVEFLEEDYDSEPDLVIIGVNGMWSVFQLQGPTPKNDFCRIFSRSSALYPLSQVLNRALDEQGELAELVQGKIVNIFLLFSQAENYVKESVADRMILKSVLKDLRRMKPNHQLTMLKFIKNLSMLATTLEALQNSNAIEVLADLLGSTVKYLVMKDQPKEAETPNQIVITLFNLCRLSKLRQEDAALNGVIPLLLRIAATDKPVKNFALPVLCDMAHSGKVCRKILWQSKGLNFYVSLLPDIYWGAQALDAIFIWLQEETAKVEEYLLRSTFSQMVIHCFNYVEGDPFENLLDPLQKLLRLSPPIAASLADAKLFESILRKLPNKKAVVRLNLLRIVRSMCEACEEQGELIQQYRLHDAIARLAESDPAVLVRNMAQDLQRLSEISRSNLDGNWFRGSRRTSSAAMTPPSLYSASSSSLPPTPQGTRSAAPSPGYFEVAKEYNMPRSRVSNVGGSATPFRPLSKDGPKATPDKPMPSSSNGIASGVKSRLPRTPVSRLSQSSASSKRDDNMPPPPTPSSSAATPRSGFPVNSRKRRQKTGPPGD